MLPVDVVVRETISHLSQVVAQSRR